ncbi:ABC transporter permease [Teredinibacter sp. KSP-S5-2]|uniref:ABC transporter permease n=1 Tax=Teredinibacter sp. KSP-S5-2 TaxID=3034506 RepID=UPI002935266C|nr:FtsX-like permease family protein [Teredinibacter sp. KSP-S5-2]WNO11305.1 FtsX-like permease family protein [Teredinibacter sp. KSP-S5-2]
MNYWILLYKNITRNRLRSTLSFCSVVIAFLLFGLLGALNSAFNSGSELADNYRLVVSSKSSMMKLLPVSYVDSIDRIEGVDAVSHQSWFGGYYKTPRNSFAQFPVDIDRYLSVYPETKIPPEQLERFKANRIGAAVGEKIADKYNWKLGDKISLTSAIYSTRGDFTWEFDVEAIFPSSEKGGGQLMLFHYDYFDGARDFARGEVGWLGVRLGHSKNASLVATLIDSRFGNSSTETKTSTEKAFGEAYLKQFGDVGFVTKIILSAVFFTMMLITGSSISQSVRERMSEIALFKTIGFSDFSIVGLVLMETLVVSTAGYLVGMASAYGLTELQLVKDSLPNFSIGTENWFFALFISLIFGVVSGVAPSLTILKSNVALTLRRNY